MKKLLFLLTLIISINIQLYSQTYNTVDITDEIYTILSNAEMRGLCETLPNKKPYTQAYILQTINTIIENLEDSNLSYKDKEIQELELYKSKYEYQNGADFRRLIFRTENQKEDTTVTVNVNLSQENFFSDGIYSVKSLNSFGYEAWGNLKIFGDIGNNISYGTHVFLGATEMPLKKLGTYEIGYWWYDVPNTEYATTSVRTIDKYRNTSVLPFSYKKFWDGSVYYFKGGMNAEGLTGWAFQDAGAFGMYGEIGGSFKSGLIEFTIGRLNREWGAMDENSSLVFNSNAHPMFAAEIAANPVDWLSFSSLTGFLEFPNQGFMLDNAWYLTDGKGNYTGNYVVDSYFFHNIFCISMLDINFKYVHWDFGSTVIMPNRFELGYSFPLLDKVVYQNNVGDYDNLALFTNLKLKYPGIGFIWGSFYLDEMNSLTSKLKETTRCMFAYQGGVKASIPILPFTDISLRYTKVEPYCYTHQALSASKSQPYFPKYISESYTNNGESIGYYLPPNADELFVQVETKPFTGSKFSLGYQLIRHGVDWGSQSQMNSGSSIHSELIPGRPRTVLKKYFLHDGTYEWYNIINFTSSYNFNAISVPVQLYCTIGYVHNWFTTIGGNAPSTTTPYYKFSNAEYNENKGAVISIGLKLFKL